MNGGQSSPDVEHFAPCAERQRLGDVLLLHDAGSTPNSDRALAYACACDVEIGDRARDPSHPVHPAPAEPPRAHAPLEELGCA